MKVTGAANGAGICISAIRLNRRHATRLSFDWTLHETRLSRHATCRNHPDFLSGDHRFQDS